MKKTFIYSAAFFMLLTGNGNSQAASVEKLTEIVFSYIKGSDEWLNGRSFYGPDISAYKHHASLKRVLLPAFEDDDQSILLSLEADDLSDRGYRAPSLGITFLRSLSHNFGAIPPGSIFQDYPAAFNLSCITEQSCDPLAVKEVLVKYLSHALVRSGVNYRWNKAEKLIRDVTKMTFELAYEDIYIFTFAVDRCPDSCMQEFDILITQAGEVLGSRVVKELIVESF